MTEHDRFYREFGVEPPADSGKLDLWPGYVGSFIRRHPHADVGDDVVPQREALNGLFGLVPHWSHDTKITRQLTGCPIRRPSGAIRGGRQCAQSGCTHLSKAAIRFLP